MKVKDQVINFELAEKLKELNFKQDSLFWWEELDGLTDVAYLPQKPEINFMNLQLIKSGRLKFYSAFTVSELDEMLPWRINENHYLTITKTKDVWEVEYDEVYDGNYVDHLYIKEEKNLANALASTLIYLLEKKLI